MDQIKVMIEWSEIFRNLSGQKVSFQKSNICFSNNVANEVSDLIAKTTGIPRTKDLGYYVGSPSFHDRVE